MLYKVCAKDQDHEHYKSQNRWIEYEADSDYAAFKKYFHQHICVHDADTCGNEEYSVAVADENGKIVYFEVDYSWYIDYDPEWELVDDLSVKEVNQKDLRFPISRPRDWLFV